MYRFCSNSVVSVPLLWKVSLTACRLCRIDDGERSDPKSCSEHRAPFPGAVTVFPSTSHFVTAKLAFSGRLQQK